MNVPQYLMYQFTMINSYFKINPIDLSRSSFLEFNEDVRIINDYESMKKYADLTNDTELNVLTNAQRTTLSNDTFQIGVPGKKNKNRMR